MAKEIALTRKLDPIISEKHNGLLDSDINLKAYLEYQEFKKFKNLKPGTFLAFIKGLFIGANPTLSGLHSKEKIKNSPDVVFIKQANTDIPPFEIRGEKFVEIIPED